MEDDELIASLAGGDDTALRQLFDRHAPWLAARLRKHPRNRYGFLLAISSYPSDTLFGEDFTTSWSPYVLWEIDLEGQSLRDAWLAAVGDMDKKPKIWCSKPLPPAALPPVRSADGPSSDKPDDGWDEWWENKGSGDEPA